MATDYEANFLAAAGEAIAKLEERQRLPRTWTSDDGLEVDGWAYSYDSYSTEKLNGNQLREYWGNSTVILATDGQFWRHSFSGEESSGGHSSATNSLNPKPPSDFVGSKGKPFEEAIQKLERLPYE